jgi:hypothetical protein
VVGERGDSKRSGGIEVRAWSKGDEVVRVEECSVAGSVQGQAGWESRAFVRRASGGLDRPVEPKGGDARNDAARQKVQSSYTASGEGKGMESDESFVLMLCWMADCGGLANAAWRQRRNSPETFQIAQARRFRHRLSGVSRLTFRSRAHLYASWASSACWPALCGGFSAAAAGLACRPSPLGKAYHSRRTGG